MPFKACQYLVKEMCEQWVEGDVGATPQTSLGAWVGTTVGFPCGMGHPGAVSVLSWCCCAGWDGISTSEAS